MGHRALAKKRQLSEEEAMWIDKATMTIRDCNQSIASLADVLVTFSEAWINSENDPDPDFKNELYQKMVLAASYSINDLSGRISERQGFIEDTLVGITAAEMRGRTEYVHKMCSQLHRAGGGR